MTEDFKAGADAAKAIAETTGKGIDAASGLTKWLDDAFGVKDALGLAYRDKMHVRRWENAQRMLLQAKQRIEAEHIQIAPVHPRVGIPLLEKASLEDDPEIVRLWANLLASALDPATAAHVRRMFVSILGEMMPRDAVLLRALYNSQPGRMKEPGERDMVFFFAGSAEPLLVLEHHLPDDSLSWQNLERLGCLLINGLGGRFNGAKLTDLGAALCDLCMREPTNAATDL